MIVFFVPIDAVFEHLLKITDSIWNLTITNVISINVLNNTVVVLFVKFQIFAMASILWAHISFIEFSCLFASQYTYGVAHDINTRKIKKISYERRNKRERICFAVACYVTLHLWAYGSMFMLFIELVANEKLAWIASPLVNNSF